MRRSLVVLMLGAGLSGCVTPPSPPAAPPEPTTPYKISYADAEGIYAAMQRTLKDAMSAEYPITYGLKGASGTIYACGAVIAKNSFGAYTGWTPYFAMGTPEKKFIVIAMGGTPSEDEIARHMCRRAGFAVTP